MADETAEQEYKGPKLARPFVTHYTMYKEGFPPVNVFPIDKADWIADGYVAGDMLLPEQVHAITARFKKEQKALEEATEPAKK